MRAALQHSGVLVLLACFAAAPGSSLAGENGAVALPGNRQVSWSDVTFTGSKFSAYVTVHMRLESIAGSSGNVSAPLGSAWGCCPKAAQDGRSLTIDATWLGLGVEDRYQERIWFTEHDGLPYMRNRLNLGDASWVKSYCWEESGIRRHKVVPGNSAEKKLPASAWSRHTESLYRYPEDRTGCGTISDPSLIVYEVSNRTPVGQPFELCVFGKKQLHRVVLTQEEAVPLRLVYTLRSPARPETVVEDRILPVVYAVASESLETATETPETFSLFGLQQDIRIYLDPEKGMPVRISGTVNGIGTLELELQSVTID